MENIKPIEVPPQVEGNINQGPGPIQPSETDLINQTLDQCTTLIETYKPRFNDAIGKLSSNKMRRLLRVLVEYPVNDKAYNPKDEGEKAVFMLGIRILEAKHTLIMYTMFGAALKQSTSKAAEVVAPEVVNEVKENNNG